MYCYKSEVSGLFKARYINTVSGSSLPRSMTSKGNQVIPKIAFLPRASACSMLCGSFAHYFEDYLKYIVWQKIFK
jgi:hypothetical protein